MTSSNRLRAVFTAVLAIALVAACDPATTRPVLEEDPEFSLQGVFDTTRQGYYPPGSSSTDTIVTVVNDSILGTLEVTAIATAPRGKLTITKCGTCFGAAAATRSDAPDVSRNGDSIVFVLFYDLMSRLEMRGVHRGDSIVGTMKSIRLTSVSTIHVGRFVARRK